MDEYKVQEICNKALDKLGVENLMRVTQEECAELIVAISHATRRRDDWLDNLVEEMADVQIMIWRMQALINQTEARTWFGDAIAHKLNRLNKMLEEVDED